MALAQTVTIGFLTCRQDEAQHTRQAQRRESRVNLPSEDDDGNIALGFGAFEVRRGNLKSV